MKRKSKVYLLIFMILTSMVLNMAHPVTPSLMRELNLPSIMFGIFFASMSLGNFLFSPIWGTLSDNKGRIKFLIIGIFGYGVAQLGFGIFTNPLIIIFFRILAGAFATSYLTVILAYLSDITTKENRIKYMSYGTASTTVGGAIGSLLGGFLGNADYKIAFIFQFIFATILSLLVYLFLEETIVSKDNENKKSSIKINIFSFKQYKTTLDKDLSFIMIIVILFFFSSTSYSSSINYYIESILELPSSFNGAFLAVTGILGLLSNLLLTAYIGKKFNSKKSFIVLTLLSGLFIGIATLSQNIIVFFVFIIMFIAVLNIYIPIQQNVIIKLSKNNYGAIMGIQNSAKAFGMIVGSLFAGSMFDLNAKIPFFASSIILFISFFSLIKSKISID